MKTSVKRRAKNCIRGAVLLACFIAVWYVASCFTQPLFIPAPATVWEAIVGLAETGQLQKGLAYSFLRITGASALSMLVAIPLSLLIYGVKPIKETIMPVVSFLRYVPVTAFSPLLILWFGIGEQMKISFLFIATFVYLLPSILLCFNDVPQDLMDTGKTIGMTSWETIKEILLPASLPSIFSTFLMMYGIGWTYCAVVEATNAIQVEGNINARNYSDSGQALSAERAKAVAKYFIACGIDPNRLITVGNGNTKMVADPGSADAYLNRRTDVFFKIIEE